MKPASPYFLSSMWFRVLFLFFLCLGADVLAARDRLLLVQAIWRHGSRTPTRTYPKDLNKEWPEGEGELTRLGFKQQYDLGNTLRERYIKSEETAIDGISPDYNPSEIYVRSTDVNRTLLSASANMFSFYPYDFTKGIEDYNPVPVHTISNPIDYTLNPDRTCPRKKYLWSFVKQTPEYNAMLKNNIDFFDFLENKTGWPITPDNIWEVNDILFIESKNNKALPDWVYQKWQNNLTVRQKIKMLNDEVEYWDNGLHLAKYNDIDFSVEIPKLRGGTLLWELINRFQQKWDCASSNPDTQNSGCNEFVKDIKYYAYSAHDTTLAALFSVFGFEKTNFMKNGYPHYSSCVALELWQNGTDKAKNYIKAYYLPLVGDHEHTTLLDITPNITNCDECDIAQFTQRSKVYQPLPDSLSLCNNVSPDVDAPKRTELPDATIPKRYQSLSDARKNLYKKILVL